MFSLISFAYVDFQKASAEKILSRDKLLNLSELQFCLKEGWEKLKYDIYKALITSTQLALNKGHVLLRAC